MQKRFQWLFAGTLVFGPVSPKGNLDHFTFGKAATVAVLRNPMHFPANSEQRIAKNGLPMTNRDRRL
jgi:hypothetical protein